VGREKSEPAAQAKIEQGEISDRASENNGWKKNPAVPELPVLRIARSCPFAASL